MPLEEKVRLKCLLTVAKDCEKELKEFCARVTPGEGRILVCLYAYQDRLSARCEYALYDAGAQLEHAVATLTYLTNECGDDLKKHCGAVKPAVGRAAGTAPVWQGGGDAWSHPSRGRQEMLLGPAEELSGAPGRGDEPKVS